jgi:uncharacterized protein (TIGR02118 family)
MIKVSVMYPNTVGAHFDHAYYEERHMHMVQAKLGAACAHYTVDKGLSGLAPGAAATYIAMCHIFSESVESFRTAFSVHAQEIVADIANYTDLHPDIQISEVVG